MTTHEQGRELSQSTDQIPLVEIFDSIEGEGIQAGIPMTFVRLSNCNFACAWCDTPYNKTHIRLYPTELAQLLVGKQAPWIKFTGGEPTMCQKLDEVIQEVSAKSPSRFCIETNGSLWNPALKRMHYITVSPKFEKAPGQLITPKQWCADKLVEEAHRLQIGELRFCIASQTTETQMDSIWEHPILKVWDPLDPRRPWVIISPVFSPVTPLSKDWESGQGHPGAKGVVDEASLNKCLRFIAKCKGSKIRLSLQTHKLLGAR